MGATATVTRLAARAVLPRGGGAKETGASGRLLKLPAVEASKSLLAQPQLHRQLSGSLLHDLGLLTSWSRRASRPGTESSRTAFGSDADKLRVA